MNIQHINTIPQQQNTISVYPQSVKTDNIPASTEQLKYIANKRNDKCNLISLNNYTYQQILCFAEESYTETNTLENYRKLGAEAYAYLKSEKLNTINITDHNNNKEYILSFIEGLLLKSYHFNKYKTLEPETFSLESVNIYSPNTTDTDTQILEITTSAVFSARDLVNTPVIDLSAVKLSETAQKLANEAGLQADVFDKQKIEELKMGGLLSVNAGSFDPPTFTTLQWKPADALNTKPIVLVGKGIVYDTGGLSLKPTPNSMDQMKSDMAGAATVMATIYAIALLKIPVYTVALVPSTDNRPGKNAYTPGDVITMHNGKTVEIKNTDAEGRLILADGLSYAKNFDPALSISVATLTGNAALAIGPYGIVAMGNTTDNSIDKLKQSGEKTFERVVEFPFWEEYGKSLKSDIADLKNLGEREGGAISAGKFLENFTEAPFIHLDIAGPAFVSKSTGYIPKGGTGTGVRMLIDFVKNYFNQA